MIDNFGRKINYLRFSVTDRCDLRCRYCMPTKNEKFAPNACAVLITAPAFIALDMFSTPIPK